MTFSSFLRTTSISELHTSDPESISPFYIICGSGSGPTITDSLSCYQYNNVQHLLPYNASYGVITTLVNPSLEQFDISVLHKDPLTCCHSFVYTTSIPLYLQQPPYISYSPLPAKPSNQDILTQALVKVLIQQWTSLLQGELLVPTPATCLSSILWFT